MKILLFCDDFYHPGKIPADGLRNLGVEFDEIWDAANFDAGMLRDYDVVVMSKCDHISQADNAPWKTREVQAEFVKYVENGGGLLVTHSGIVAGEDTGVLDSLIGCRFVSHPHDCPVFVGAVKPHPVTHGVDVFCETDEHYHVEILAGDVEILAASFAAAQGDAAKYETEPYFNAPAFIAPAAYVRHVGKGRVCVLTPGHTPEVWANPQFAKLLANALEWASRPHRH